MTPIVYEAFEFDDIETKGILYFHLWGKFVCELFKVLDKFQEKFEDANIDIDLNDIESDIAEYKVFNSVNSKRRVSYVHKYRMNKIRQSVLKTVRRMFMLFGLCLIVGVPLIVNDDYDESIGSYKVCMIVCVDK